MATTSEEAGIQPIGGLSHVRGDTRAALSEQSIPALLADTVARFGHRPAVLFREQGVRWTWREFATVVDELAAGLLGLGLQRGDRLGIWSPNRAEWLVTQFATARIGVILVNINPAYRLSELEYALNLSGCRAIVTAERLKTSMYLQMLQTLAPELAHSEPGKLKSARLPALQWVIRMGAEATHCWNAAAQACCRSSWTRSARS
jgi:fatty-acyl-CoA synthase